MSCLQVNQRKILKWVFLILQEHHERLGLKVMAWDGGPGPGGRLGFYFHTVLNPHERFGAYRLPANHGLDMSMYQERVGVFEGTQDYSAQAAVEMRTKEVLPKLERELDVVGNYHKAYEGHRFPHQEADPTWPGRAAVYLYSWNVFGLWQAKRKVSARYYSIASFPWDYVKPRWLEETERGLAQVIDCKDVLVLIDDQWLPQVFWNLNGGVTRLSDRRAVNLRLCQTQGVPPAEAVGLIDKLLGGLDLQCHHVEG